MSALRPAGRQDPRIVVLLGVVLLLCLGAVAGSWLWTHRKPSAKPRQSSAARLDSLTQEVDFLVKAIENRLRREDPPLDLKRLATRRALASPAPSAPKPAPAPAKAEGPLHLKGIAWHPNRPVAFINERAFECGDSVGAFRVKAITANSVTLQEPQGGTRVLTLDEK